MLYIVLSIIVVFLLQTTIHEGCHAIMALIQGQGIKSFKPYPHFVSVNNKKKLYFGRVVFEHNYRSKSYQKTLRSWAPFIFCVPLFFIMFFVHLIINDFVYEFYLYWAALSIDVCRGLVLSMFPNKMVDINNGARFIKMPQKTLQYFSIPLASFMSFVLLFSLIDRIL